MGTSRLMKPLFCGGMFNREGRRMRAVFVRSVSNGTQTYRLWRTAGKPGVEYNRAENDKYLLHVEINGCLTPLGLTDYDLINRCGFESAAQKLYGGRENRGKWIDSLREAGGNDAVSAAVAEEQRETARYGGNPVRQAAYIRNFLDEHVSAYLKAKKNGGRSFPDFIGALVMGELPGCVELSTVYKAKLQAEQAARAAQTEAEEKVYCAERNQEAENAVSTAVQIIRNGGILENDTIKFYNSRYSIRSYSIVNYLMRQYQVDVPLRTQGWINDKLVNATIEEGRCVYLRYLCAKGTRASQKFFSCMNELIRAVAAQSPDNAA